MPSSNHDNIDYIQSVFPGYFADSYAVDKKNGSGRYSGTAFVHYFNSIIRRFI
jgi:hypothetical protein